jgi:hypothetical protein
MALAYGEDWQPATAHQISPLGAPTSRFGGQGGAESPPAIPSAVTEAIERAESKEEKVAIAFNYLLRPELDLRLGANSMVKMPADAQLALVRLYERLSGVMLLPPDVV